MSASNATLPIAKTEPGVGFTATLLALDSTYRALTRPRGPECRTCDGSGGGLAPMQCPVCGGSGEAPSDRTTDFGDDQ